VNWLAQCLSLGHIPDTTDAARQFTLSKTSNSQASLQQIRVICITSHLRKVIEKALFFKLKMHNLFFKDNFLATPFYQQGFKE